MTKTTPLHLPREPLLKELYRRPGFMIRRAHQIAIDMFIAACAPVDVTPSQYGVLYILNLVDPMSQIGIARLIGLDRSTTALVITILMERSFVTKTPSLADTRKVEISITTDGKRALHQAAKMARQEMGMLLTPFSEEEGKTFLSLLAKFVTHHNRNTRVSIQGPRLPD